VAGQNYIPSNEIYGLTFTSFPTFVFSFIDGGHCDRGEMEPVCTLISNFLMAKDVEHVFMYFFPYCLFSMFAYLLIVLALLLVFNIEFFIYSGY
jgi:hypothetical protein